MFMYKIILNFEKKLYEKKRSMLPYWIGCVYRFVDNILYQLSEYRIKVISVQHYNPYAFMFLYNQDTR